MLPTRGRVVWYTLSQADVDAINDAREKSGIQGNSVRAGDIYPAEIVRVWGNGEGAACNIDVNLDGPDRYWATSRTVGEGEGHWAWPPRAGA